MTEFIEGGLDNEHQREGYLTNSSWVSLDCKYT